MCRIYRKTTNNASNSDLKVLQSVRFWTEKKYNALDLDLKKNLNALDFEFKKIQRVRFRREKKQRVRF